MKRLSPVALALVFAAETSFAQGPALAVLDDVAIEQRIGDELPLDAEFRDAGGNVVELGSLFGSRPVLLAPVYYECPMLCQEVLSGLVRGLKGIPFDVGIELDVVAISFDTGEPPEVAAAKRADVIRRYGDRGSPAGWHFLTGDRSSVERFTEAIGFRYVYDEARDEFAHASAVVLATPDGRIARYLFGIDFAPRDLRLGIVEAGEGALGGPVEALLLYCYHYDPLTGRYGVVVMNVLRLAGLLTVLALGSFIVVNLRRDRRPVPAVRTAPPNGG